MPDLGPAAAMLAATLGLGASPATDLAPADAAPITLVTEATPEGVVVQVVGRSATPVDVAYALEVTSGPPGSNRSTQRGSARLRPNERVVLLTTRLGGSAGRDWQALLTVTPGSGEPYRVERRGS